MTETDVVLSVIAIITCVFAAIPAALTWQNLKIFCTSPQTECSEPVSVLVPARNEEQVLDGFIRNILASRGVQLELVVLDDASTDSTAQRVSQWSDCDPRVRLVHGKKLPQGWCGKQHACYQLAESARVIKYNKFKLNALARQYIANETIENLFFVSSRH